MRGSWIKNVGQSDKKCEAAGRSWGIEKKSMEERNKRMELKE